MTVAKDENNESSNKSESMARIHGNLLGLRLSLVAFAISASSREGIRQYIEVLSIVKEAISQTAIEEDSHPFDELFAEEADRVVQEISNLLSKTVSALEDRNEH